MKREEILKKAIEKARANGYPPYSWTEELGLLSPHTLRGWLLDIDFAKAFWGEREKLVGQFETQKDYIPAWQYHLQQMVLEEDPIKYLEQFIKE